MKNNKLHIGQEIKKQVKLRFKTYTSFSKAWGKSRQAVYDLFEKETVDVNTLLEICKVTSYDFFKLYQSQLHFNKENPHKKTDSKEDIQPNECVEAVLQIRLGKEKQDKILQLVFGDHNLKILHGENVNIK